MSETKILVAGHGGQGILLLGDYIAYSAMLESKHVACTPSYGPETRGGKAKCYVVISDMEVDNPIAEDLDIEIIMNQPSMVFLNQLRPHGLIFYNKSLIDAEIDRADARVFGIPATEIADTLKVHSASNEVKDTKIFANAVMFGAFLEMCAREIKEGLVRETLKHFLVGRKEILMSLNLLALAKGREFVRASPQVENMAQWPFHCLPSWAAQ